MENIDCGVLVSIGMEVACYADQGRVVLTISLVHDSAARTLLRGKARGHLHDTMRLVKKHDFNLVPAHVDNIATEPALLCDVPTSKHLGRAIWRRSAVFNDEAAPK